MKHLKMLALTAVSVAALMAFIGTGLASASSTTLCSTNTNPCTGTTYGVGTIIKSEMKAGTEATLKAGFATIKCKKLSGEGEIKDFSAGGTPTGTLTSTPFSECNCVVTALKYGSIEVTTETAGTANGNGIIIGRETEETINCSGVSCIFGTASGGSGGTTLGPVTGGNPAVFKTNAKVPWFAGDASNSVCTLGTGTASISAEMVETSPTPMFIE